MAGAAAIAGGLRRRLGLLGQGDFRRLWIGETISQVGSQVSVVAIPVIATVTLRATPFEVALLSALQFLPFVLLALPAGAWLDRVRRRPVLISGDLVRLVALGTIPAAWAVHALTIWQLFAVSLISGAATVFFDVAYQSYLPALIDRGDLVEGNAKLGASEAAAEVVGPGVAGGLVSLVGAPFAVIADALSYLASAVYLSKIRRPEPHPEAERRATGRPRDALRRQVADGFAFVVRNPCLRAIAAATATGNLFSNVMYAVMPVYLLRDLGLTPAAYGLVFSLGSIGTLAGALVASEVGRRVGVGRTIVLSSALLRPAALLIPLAPHAGPMPWVVAAVALSGFGVVVYNVNQLSFRQAITPLEIQGRMNATMRFLVWGTIPIGSVLGGALATAVGVQSAIAIGAVGVCLAWLPVFLSPVRSLRAIPAPSPSGS